MAQNKRPSIAKEGAWVTVHSYDYASTTLEHEAEDGFMDIVFEKQISLANQSTYFKKTVKIVSEAGIQNSSEISVDFDPSYQQVSFHTIRIVRDNKIINQLDLHRMKVIQQEKELSRYVYNGSLTAVLILEDVRKGDVVEYSYTLKGANPVFRGRYASTFDLNYNVPISHLYYKLILPKGRSIFIKNKGTDIRPAIQTLPQETIYEWKAENVASMHLQDNLPGWYDPFSEVMVSEYQSWKEVNDWAMELFPAVKSLSPALLNKINDIRTKYPSREDQVLSALRFVEDDVRYMGIEIGENSHRPGSPDKIFSQRFGDCKDKSYLLCTMLGSLGIEASPVLINSRSKQDIVDWLPAANAFDHATVRINLDGRYYWFDPTISFQRGNINSISYPDYRYGLVIAEGTTALTPVNQKEPGMVKVKETFDIPDMSGNARLTVISRYTGSYADDTRSSFNNTSRFEMQKTYRDYYATYFEDISADSLSFSEEDSSGTFVTKEYYTIGNLWELKEGIRKAYFNAFVIDGILRKPKETQRKMPFALQYPAKYKEEVVVNLPEEWSIEESKEYIENDAFRMSARFSYTLRKAILAYEYEALQDHVPTDKSKQYVEALRKKDDNFSYFFSKAEDGTSIKPKLSVTKDKKGNSSIFVFISLVLGAALVIWRVRKSA